ncbi:unnamed protein product [Protopolystoma xenopodis]|uniref:Uncharacterized protein n=1 Tax=Protopolystoma xenopodis TaxID=117903 RepID=A0A448WTL6_9PLAT|nr:unnamed protein product [Protopolystoma xenopodis]
MSINSPFVCSLSLVTKTSQYASPRDTHPDWLVRILVLLQLPFDQNPVSEQGNIDRLSASETSDSLSAAMPINIGGQIRSRMMPSFGLDSSQLSGKNTFDENEGGSHANRVTSSSQSGRHHWHCLVEPKEPSSSAGDIIGQARENVLFSIFLSPLTRLRIDVRLQSGLGVLKVSGSARSDLNASDKSVTDTPHKSNSMMQSADSSADPIHLASRELLLIPEFHVIMPSVGVLGPFISVYGDPGSNFCSTNMIFLVLSFLASFFPFSLMF